MDRELYPAGRHRPDSAGGGAGVEHREPQRGPRDDGDTGAKRLATSSPRGHRPQLAPDVPRYLLTVELGKGVMVDWDVFRESFWSMSGKPRIVDVRTARENGIPYGVMFVHDRGVATPAFHPDGTTTFPGATEIALYRVRRTGSATVVPEFCGAYVGAYIDSSGQWLVFRSKDRAPPARSTSPAESAPAHHSVAAEAAGPGRERASSASSGSIQGSRPGRGATAVGTKNAPRRPGPGASHGD